MEKPKIFLFHFAGGNAYSFQFLTPFWGDLIPVALELPGRGKRLREPLLYDFGAAALDLCNQVRSRLTAGPFLIYGHSMGAYLALRVCNMLEKTGASPDCLIVSGTTAPGVTIKEKRYLLGRDEFIEKVEELGGVPPELSGNQEFFNFFEPILRADFEITEKNDIAADPPVSAPIYAMMGDREENTDKIAQWTRFTRSSFGHQILPGDHFFIQKQPQKIAGIIRSCLKYQPPRQLA